MIRNYHTMDKQGKVNARKLGEFLTWNGQQLLPMVDLIEQVPVLIWRGIHLLGTHMAEAEEEAGHSGVAQNILYTSWW